MIDTSVVLFSHKDINLSVILPETLSEELAYFLGVLVGDGYVKYYVPKKDYQLCIDGNKCELRWYKSFLKPLVMRLFNKNPTVRLTQTTVQLSLRSKAVFFFLTKSCGITPSPKTHCTIPVIIQKADLIYKASFLRGLADTDFSLVFKKNGKYPVIDFCTCSKELLSDVISLLFSFGFKGHSGIYRTERNGTPITRYYLQINGIMNLEKWMGIIGFSSPTQLNKYTIWKQKGAYLRTK